MSSHHREILAALEKLKSGARQLSAEQYLALLEALEQASEALHGAPRGSDPVASGLWWNHERSPALARLADALAPVPRAAAARRQHAAELRDDRAVARALQESLEENTRR